MFTPANAGEMGRKGGRATLERYGTEHYRELGRKGFAAYARKLGFAGGSRRGALARLLSRGKLADRYPDQSDAISWAAEVLERLDPENPEVPY